MTISLDDLLASRLLDVPDYQRGYAWGSQQLGEFWEDLELIEPGGGITQAQWCSTTARRSEKTKTVPSR